MNSFVWSGRYSSKHEAERALGSPKHDALWSSSSWLERQHQLVTVTRRNLAVGSVYGARPSTLPAVCAGTPGQTVVDFGGGSGWIFFLLEGLDLTPKSYVSFDVPEVIRYFEQYSGPRLKYRDPTFLVTEPEVAPIDILYTNSTLQYLDESTEFMRAVCRLRPRLVLIDELLWTHGLDDWFAVQKNSDQPVVARFLSLKTLEDEMRSAGFRLTWSGAFGEGGHPTYTFPDMGDYPPTWSISHAKTLLFSRATRHPELHERTD